MEAISRGEISWQTPLRRQGVRRPRHRVSGRFSQCLMAFLFSVLLMLRISIESSMTVPSLLMLCLLWVLGHWISARHWAVTSGHGLDETSRPTPRSLDSTNLELIVVVAGRLVKLDQDTEFLLKVAIQEWPSKSISTTHWCLDRMSCLVILFPFLAVF